MHDIRWIREHPDEFDRGMERRGLEIRAEKILALDRRWREAQTRSQEAQAERNRRAREIAAAKLATAGVGPSGPLGHDSSLRQKAETAAAEAAQLRAEIDEILAGLPNVPADDVPD